MSVNIGEEKKCFILQYAAYVYFFMSRFKNGLKGEEYGLQSKKVLDHKADNFLQYAYDSEILIQTIW